MIIHSSSEHPSQVTTRQMGKPMWKQGTVLFPFLHNDPAAPLGLESVSRDYSPSGQALTHILNEEFSMTNYLQLKQRRIVTLIVIVYLRISKLTRFQIASQYALCSYYAHVVMERLQTWESDRFSHFTSWETVCNFSNLSEPIKWRK